MDAFVHEIAQHLSFRGLGVLRLLSGEEALSDSSRFEVGLNAPTQRASFPSSLRYIVVRVHPARRMLESLSRQQSTTFASSSDEFVIISRRSIPPSSTTRSSGSKRCHAENIAS